MKEHKQNENNNSKKREEWKCAVWNKRGWGGKKDNIKRKK